MGNKALTLSIVIPVYNEQRYLKACLNAIGSQIVAADEVIVVDNNSTDKSVSIARKYKFVKLLHEPRQHQAFAQKTGFDAAKGDIIGRIDGDTVLPKDWCLKVKRYFAEHPETVALTGGARPYDVVLATVGKFIQALYHRLSEAVAGHRLLWGTNSALRRSAWRKVSSEVTARDDIWEDFDISFLLIKHGDIARLPNIEVGTSFRAVHKPPAQQVAYHFREVRTFVLRAGRLKGFLIGMSWLSKLLVLPLIFIDEFVLKPLLWRSRHRRIGLL